jgi:Zn-dependent peptidase ImmA (M78 family)
MPGSRSKSACAIREALEVRRCFGYKPWDSICPYDIAEKMGVEVRFVDIPSLEGMYWRQSRPTIILSSLRPATRQAFTCAHELGHHVLGHGTSIDEFQPGDSLKISKAGDEYLAQVFAGFLLMPKIAVEKAFSLRGFALKEPSPVQYYRIANWLGVGYSSLSVHVSAGLGIISEKAAKDLMKYSLKSIRTKILGQSVPYNLVVVDQFWGSKPVDLQIGDLVLADPFPDFEGECLNRVDHGSLGILLQARKPGTGRLFDSSGSAVLIRISKRSFVGRSIYRYLEDASETAGCA